MFWIDAFAAQCCEECFRGRRGAVWGYPVQLRFAHEMNGDWYPSAESVNGNQPGDYVQAAARPRHHYRAGCQQRLVGLGPQRGVLRVHRPCRPVPGGRVRRRRGLGRLQLGHLRVLERVGLSPQDLFGPGIAPLRALAPGVPILVAETASSEAGGDKAGWNTSLVSYLAAQPDVTGFVWFHLQKETDWRINSSASSAAAFKNALQARRTS